MNPWYENDIQRFNREKDHLESLDVLFEIDQSAYEQKLLRLKLKIESNNPHFDLPGGLPEFIQLVAIFPDLYPYFRPQVYALNLKLPRHQNMVDGGLCLLGRPSELWDPQLTLAEFLAERLKEVIKKGNITDEVTLSTDPTEQAEPESVYFNPDATILFDPSVIVTQNTKEVEMLGRIIVGIGSDNSGQRFAVLQTKDSKGNQLSRLPDVVETLFPEKIHGVLYNVPGLIPSSPDQQFLRLQDLLKNNGNRIYFHGTDKKIKSSDGPTAITNIIGLNFPEETTAGKKTMDGWLFIVTADVYKSTIPNGRKVKHRKYYYAKPLRISASDINIRIPKLECLKDKRIAVIGLGALGAPSAIEFAKAGVSELRIVDYDKVDAATTVRWPIGLTAAGYPKTLVVENFIKTNYPYTNISSFNLRIGSNRAAADTPTDSILPFELDSLNQLFDGISLLYDASAEEGVTHFLSVEARKRNIPFVNIWATEGALGGQVLRVIPGQTEGCWMCSMYHRLDEKITAPPFDANGKIQTRGCGDITFTGAGFDLQNITLAGVRMAVSILSKECENSYPFINWDIGVLSMLNKNGDPEFPCWKHYNLAKHPNCPYCNA